MKQTPNNPQPYSPHVQKLLAPLNFLSQERVAVFVGLILRCLIAWILPWLLDQTAVPYTDVDYHVFMEAAHRLQRGISPYMKPSTYRYTPFLAALLASLPTYNTGRILFCLADTACGWMILHMRRTARLKHDQSLQLPPPKSLSTTATFESSPSSTAPVQDTWQHVQDVAWWLYNPLAINICTRGSAESLVVILPVLVTLQIATLSSSPYSQKQQWWWVWSAAASLVAGLVHGVAIHAKLYPIIYTLSYAAYFATRTEQRLEPFQSTNKNNATIFFHVLKTWLYRLLSPLPIIFLGASVLSFVTLTYLAVVWYGQEALQEGIVYHLSRVDHRHNYSMFWYWIYLAKARAYNLVVEAAAATTTNHHGITLQPPTTSSLQGLGRVLLLPQAILLIVSSLGMAPQHLSLALFVQTYLFVTLNKVITAQYFCWYLCLLPLCSDALQMTRRVQWALLGLGLAVVTWLGCAFGLEMQGLPFHRHVWFASVVYFVANINLLCAILQSFRTKQTTIQSKKKLA